MERNLGKRYSLTGIYREMRTTASKDYQEKIETILWDFLRKQKEMVSLLFFDVTTLYFESFQEDEFRKPGFSKDHKANQPQVTVTFFKEVTAMQKVDGETKRISLGKTRILVVSYSQKRAVKDRSDLEKQLRKARFALETPSTVGRSFKFLQKTKLGDFSLNDNLIEKAKLLEGLKGHITNSSSLTDKEVIEKYSQLWQVEKSFRISKSDLKARPIFHTTKEEIEAHLLIVFTALAIIRLAENTTKISCAKIPIT